MMQPGELSITRLRVAIIISESHGLIACPSGHVALVTCDHGESMIRAIKAIFAFGKIAVNRQFACSLKEAKDDVHSLWSH